MPVSGVGRRVSRRAFAFGIPFVFKLQLRLLRALQKLVIPQVSGHNAFIVIPMKLTIAFLSLVLSLGFGACSTSKTATRTVILKPCCATGEADKVVLLQDSFEPGGRVVRLTQSGGGE
jgi:hypothetical protein